MARTAVITGTATSVAGRVSGAQHAAATAGSAPPARDQGAGIDELHAQLGKLGELRQAGLLTEEEFARQKARLLG